MKIVICGSMTYANEMAEIKKKLESDNHTVVVPDGILEYVSGRKDAENKSESTKHKIEKDLIRKYYNQIGKGDAILVVNIDKGNIKNYIGGNSIIEMAFAHVLRKTIYLLNPIPEMGYTDEIVAMKPIVINGELKKIV